MNSEDLKEKARLWINANVWDGEDRAGCQGDSVKLSPDDLQDLVNDLIDALCGGEQPCIHGFIQCNVLAPCYIQNIGD